MKARHMLGVLAPPLATARRLLGSPERVRILLYHGIHTSEMATMRQQMQELARTYQFISIDEFHAFLAGDRPLRQPGLLVTFDDGYLSSANAALEVLKPLGIPAAFFLSSGFVSSRDGDWHSYVADCLMDGAMAVEQVTERQVPMDWEMVRTLIQNGFAIGSHTVEHTRLSRLTSTTQMSKAISNDYNNLREYTGVEPVGFAYPFGDIDSVSDLSMEVIKGNAQHCYSGVRGSNTPGTPRHAIRRDACSPSDPPGYLRFILEDGLDWHYRSARVRLDRLATA